MPFSHSLFAATLWSIFLSLLYAYVTSNRLNSFSFKFRALSVFFCVWAHWHLDFVVHRPDLPLIGDNFKQGLGLWNLWPASFMLELFLFFAPFYAWLQRSARARRSTSSRRVR